jgi:hypothetical protein
MKKLIFSEEERKLALEIFEHSPKKEIIEKFSKFGKPIEAIFRFAKQLGLKRDHEVIKQEMAAGGKIGEVVWTEKEDNIIKQHYASSLQKDIEGMLPGRTFRSIRGRGLALGINRNKDVIDQDRATHLKENFGVTSTWQLESTKESTRKTNLERRGVEYPTQSPEVWAKVKKTVQNRYGVDNVFQSEEIKEKLTQTNLKNFGFKNPNQCPEILAKTKATNLEKYGVENQFELTDKVKEGMIKKYGHDSPLKVPEIKERQQATNLERYGFKIPSQNAEVKEKLRKTLQTEEVKRKKYLTYKLNNTFGASKEENKFFTCLKIIDEKTIHHILHPRIDNVMDFYMPKFDLWIQFDGVYWHGKLLKASSGPRYLGIKRIMECDKFQNENIANLIRFWSDDVSKAIDNNSIINLIGSKIREKRAQLKNSSYYEKNNREQINPEDYDPKMPYMGFRKGVTPNKKISDKIHFIIDNYSVLTKQQIAEQLHESERWVKRQIANLHAAGQIKFKQTRTETILTNEDWTEEMKRYIFDLRNRLLKPNHYIVEKLKEKFGIAIGSSALQFWMNEFKFYSRSKQEWMKEYLPKELMERLLNESYRMVDISDYVKKEFDVYISDDLILVHIKKLGLPSLKLKKIKEARERNKNLIPATLTC